MNRRVAHYLQDNRGRAVPQRHLFFDVETEQVPIDDRHTEQRLVLGWALYWRRRRDPRPDTQLWLPFESAGPFWDFVEKHTSTKETLYLVSHNITFDFAVCRGFQELTRRGYELTSVYSKGMTTILRLRRGKVKIVALNNSNWFQCTLADLGHAVGLEKEEIDFRTATHFELRDYCRRDVEILLRAWQLWYAFLDENDLGNWGPTLPSQAFAAFRHRFMHHKMLVHANPKALELERDAYRGGRTSVYYCGKAAGEIFTKLDLNSAYAHAMAQTCIPARLLFYTERVTVQELREWLTMRPLIADVDLETDDNPFPLRFRGHNVYPLGRFRTVLSTPELAYALSRGWLKTVHRATVYAAEPIFEEYVGFFYTLKQRYQAENNAPFYYLAKLFLNSLYGKFGQLASSFVLVGAEDKITRGVDGLHDPLTGEIHTLYHWGDQVWREERGGEPANSMPVISGHISAAVRMRLHALRHLAGERHCYYSDTDSLIVDEAGLANLAGEIDPAQLGALKVEGTADTIEIRAPKTYKFGTDWTRKGIPERAVMTGPDTWNFEAFPSLRSIGRQPMAVPYWTRATLRTLNYTLYDGIAGADGWVVPFRGERLAQEEEQETEDSNRAWEIRSLIGVLEDSKTIPPETMLTLRNLVTGRISNLRDSQGRLVPWAYSQLDGQAQEMGYPDTDALLAAAEGQVETENRIRELRSELKQFK